MERDCKILQESLVSFKSCKGGDGWVWVHLSYLAQYCKTVLALIFELDNFLVGSWEKTNSGSNIKT